MRPYSEAVKADLRWRVQEEVVPATQKEPEGWSAADKFTVVLETAGLWP
jgi:hypothetical protein